VGCGAQKSQIGPELGFGKIVGDHHDDPVLILKFAQAGRSLGWDFLPPESKSFELKGKVYAGYRDGEKSWDKGKNPKASDAYAGKAYDESFRSGVKTLENFDRSFPAFKGSKYEIAGFVWWQGHSDTKPPYADRYEQNLVNLIKSLRKDFKAPEAPFVIGTIGIGGWKMEPAFKKIADAQLAVSNDNDNVLTVETRDYWKPANLSPKNLPHFYNNHAGTVMNVGQALGEGMVELLKKSEK
jgi:alpha-galactosidase